MKPKSTTTTQKLTTRQVRFCQEYPKDFNAAGAAVRAGYSKKTAKAIGFENLTKPDLREYINKKLSAMELSAEETTKLIGDIAKSNLNEYFVIKKVEQATTIRVSLSRVITDIQNTIEFEDEFAYRAQFSKDELRVHQAQQAERKRKVIRYQLELEKNPIATQLIDGPVEVVEVAELDMVKLVADKERGKIKSISPTPNGMRVELFAADEALVNIAKIHGLFAPVKTEHSGTIKFGKALEEESYD